MGMKFKKRLDRLTNLILNTYRDDYLYNADSVIEEFPEMVPCEDCPFFGNKCGGDIGDCRDTLEDYLLFGEE